MTEAEAEGARKTILAKLARGGAKGVAALWTPKTAAAKRAALEHAVEGLEREEAIFVDRRKSKPRYFAWGHRPALPTKESVAVLLEKAAEDDFPSLSTRKRWQAALKKQPGAAEWLEAALAHLLREKRLLSLTYRKTKGGEEVFVPISRLPAAVSSTVPFSVEAVREAYRELSARMGFPAVAISALSQASGAGPAELRAWLLAEHLAGKAILSRGDWSLADEAKRAAAVEWKGQPHLLVRLLP